MELKDASDLVSRYGVALVLDPANGVHGISIGRKDGRGLHETSDFCVTAFVTKKLTRKELQRQGVQSFDEAFEAAVEKSPSSKKESLDVVETRGAFRPQTPLIVPFPQRGRYGGDPPVLNAQRWFFALRCGIGITNPMGTYPQGLSVGTAGFFMRDDEGNRYVVSNNHVIGRSNSACAGDMVIQPGTLDLTALEFALLPTLSALRLVRIGSLTAFVPLRFGTTSPGPVNVVDAAIAQVDTTLRSSDDMDRLTFGGCICGVASGYMADTTGALAGSDRVYKVGRTTGYTEGIVTNIAVTATVPYPGGSALFSDQVAVRPTSDNGRVFSDAGDSGSGVLNDRHELVGLLFAGSPDRTLMNPIESVISALRKAANIPSLQVVHLSA